MKIRRSPGLIAIVVYKILVALLLTVTAIVLLLTIKKQQALLAFSESYILEGKLQVIELVLDRLLNLKRQTLQLSSTVIGVYAVVTAIEAIGLWYEKTWAKILVIIFVSISIPAEIFELIKSVSLLKIIIFLINIAVLLYLLKHFKKSRF